MKGTASMPAMHQLGGGGLTTKFLQRRRTTTDRLFTELQASPLHDLAPLAQPGLTSRVSRNNSVATSLHELGMAFEKVPDVEAVVVIEGGFTPALVQATMVGVLGALCYGFNLGSMNTAAEAMRLNLGIPAGSSSGDSLWGFCVSVFCLGALLGCNAGASLADSVGRQRSLTAMALVFIVGALFEVLSALPAAASAGDVAPSPGLGVLLMTLGRCAAGIASGATTVVVPMYLGEIAPPQLRGALGTVFQLTCCVGLLLAQTLGLPFVLGSASLWPIYVGLVIPPALCQLVFRGSMLESPRWLASRIDADPTLMQSLLARLRNEPEDSLPVLQELDMLQMSASSASAAFNIPGYRYGLFQMMRDETIRNGLVVAVVCALVQQFSGINNVFNFSSTFLAQNGIGPDVVMVIAVLMNVGNVLITILSVWLMDRAGRRALLLGSATAMILSIFALTLALNNPGQEWTSALAVLSVVGFVMSFGVGMGPCPWLLPAELFPVDKCAQGSALAATCNWLANFFVGQAFIPISTTLGAFCFIPFAAVLLLFVFFVLLKVPETRGKTLDQIMLDLNGPEAARDMHRYGGPSYQM